MVVDDYSYLNLTPDIVGVTLNPFFPSVSLLINCFVH